MCQVLRFTESIILWFKKWGFTIQLIVDNRPVWILDIITQLLPCSRHNFANLSADIRKYNHPTTRGYEDVCISPSA